VIQPGAHLHHIQHRNPLGDADDQRDFSVDSLVHRVHGECRRDVNHRGVGARRLAGGFHGVEHRLAQHPLAALARRHAPDHVRAVFDHLLGVKQAFAARDALNQDLRVFVRKN